MDFYFEGSLPQQFDERARAAHARPTALSSSFCEITVGRTGLIFLRFSRKTEGLVITPDQLAKMQAEVTARPPAGGRRRKRPSVLKS